MRLIGRTALGVAILSLTVLAPALAQAQDTSPHRIAVVDVAFIFKNHPGIKAQVTKVENDLKAYDVELLLSGLLQKKLDFKAHELLSKKA